MGNTLGERIRLERIARDWSQAELGAKAGLTRGAISQIETGTTQELLSENLLSIARAMDLSPEWLSTGKGEKSAYGRHTGPVQIAETGSEYELVTRVKGAVLSAGPGQITFEHEEIDSSHAFRRSWMRQHGYKPERCRVMEITGDSMMPYLVPGDVVLVNMDDTRIRSGEVYAIAVDDELRIKRLHRRADGTLEIRSDNQSSLYKTEEVPPDKQGAIKVIGRIVWRGG